jgi:hydroxymethylpyrimidine pyrophosphatase-like HAD family hydrolase
MNSNIKNTLSKQLLATLESLAPSQTIIFSDMTGTMLDQTKDYSGFPVSTRESIKNFANAGGIFTLVTGDSFEVVQDQFLNHLETISNEIFFITESGGEISLVKEKNHQILKAQPELDFQVRSKALNLIIDKINFYFDVDISKHLDLKSHTRIEIPELTKITGDLFMIELGKYKSTVFCKAGSIRDSITSKLLDDLENDLVLKELANSSKTKLMRGPVYFELISLDKQEGIKEFLSIIIQSKLKDLSQIKNILVLGDTANDEKMMLYPFHEIFPNAKVDCIFVGDEPVLENRIQNQLDTSYSRFLVLRGLNEKGINEVMKLISKKALHPLEWKKFNSED